MRRPPQNPFLERAFTDKMQDLLLIHTVVLFRGQMDQLKQIEREVRENYAQNLTLKDLSGKYYVNSAYLGQIFRKK